jgi:hypothetical protein
MEILKRQGFSENPIEQYELIGLLGQGSFGTVLLAKHKLSSVKVAIKRID